MALQAKNLFEKAMAALNAGDLQRAKRNALKLLKIERNNFSCWHLMAAIHGHLQEIPQAEKAFVKAAKLAPGHEERCQVYEQLGKLLMEKQLPAKAVQYFAELQSLQPSRGDVAYYLAEAYRLDKQYRLAVAEYDRTAELSGETPDVLYRTALCHKELGRPREAIECLQRVPDIEAAGVDLLSTLVDCYVDIDAYEEAEKLLLQALDRSPNDAELHYMLAALHRNFGNLPAAEKYFERTLSLAPDVAAVYYNFSLIRRFAADDALIDRIKNCLARLPQRDESPRQLRSRAELLFALGKIAEDNEQYESAFGYWQEANALVRGTFEYSVDDDRNRAAAIRKIVDNSLIAKLQLDRRDGPVPIFILGMPRSGSTLCEQIMSSHPEIQGMGEMMLLPRLLGEFEVSLATPYPLVLRQINREQLHELRDRYLSYVGERAETRYFTDKLPLNFWLIGLIEILFPGAPVIHAHRNPIDTGFSCYKQMFSGAQNFAYDLSEIKQYLLLHRDLMDYWRTLLPGRIFDLAYEDLVSSPEATVRAMLAFCELGWESQCLDFHQTRRAVKTSSSAQIRQPLHNDAVRFWKNYAQQLRELEGLE